MVRNYQRKSDKAKNYSKEDIAHALNELESGLITLHGASKKYNKIPKSTLHDHLKGTHGSKSQTLGRALVIPFEHEATLANGLKTLERWGFGLSRKELLLIVSDYVTKNGIKTPFKDNIPGPDWFLNFKKRHNLSIKKPQSVEYSRKKMTDPFVINTYFELLEKLYTDLQLNDRPRQIWNLDETSLCIDPSKTKVVGAKGVACSRTTSGPGKENTTILSAVSAAGDKAPPLIVFKGKNVWDQWMADKDTNEIDLSYAASTNGWMESDIFVNFITKILIPVLGEERPVLLIYDGHSTHVDHRVVKVAQDNNVTILKLPPHTSHLLQPLDLAVFKSFKTTWDAELVTWQRQNQGVKLPKKIFSEKVRKVWKNLNPSVIQNGFKKAGIYPFNSSVIPKDKYNPDALKRFESIYKTKAQANGAEETNNEEVGEDNIQSGPSTGSVEDRHSEQVDQDNIQAGPSNVSFEDLLLETVKQNATNNKSTRKRRVATGAEIITHQNLEDLHLAQNEKPSGETIKKQKRKDRNRHSTSSESSIEPLYEESDNDLDFLNDDDGTTENLENFKLHVWVLVKYCTKKTIKYYAGQITEMYKDRHECVVKFFHFNKLSNKFFWPEKEDLDTIVYENIEMFLPDPIEDRRGNLFKFDVEFSGFNIC